jgi:hypothetical protein
MKTFHALFFLLASLLLTSLPVAHAGEITSQAVHFAKGHSSTTIKATIKGKQTIDYTLRAKAGQTMGVKLQSAHGANYFNVLLGLDLHGRQGQHRCEREDQGQEARV